MPDLLIDGDFSEATLASLDVVSLDGLHRALHDLVGSGDGEADALAEEHGRVVEALARLGVGHDDVDDLDEATHRQRNWSRRQAREAVTAWVESRLELGAAGLTKAERRRVARRSATLVGDESVTGARRFAAMLQAVGSIAPAKVARVTEASVRMFREDRDSWLREAEFTDRERVCISECLASKGGEPSDQDVAICISECAGTEESEAPPPVGRVVEATGINSVGVFLRLPPEIVAAWPTDGRGDDASPPHVTLLYVGEETDPKALEVIEQAVHEAAKWMAPFRCRLFGYGEFRTPEGLTVAHMVPRAPQLLQIHESVRDHLDRVGIEYRHHRSGFVEHATLAVLPEGEAYAGTRPEGEWIVDHVEVWRGASGEVLQVPLGEKLREALALGDAPSAATRRSSPRATCR